MGTDCKSALSGYDGLFSTANLYLRITLPDGTYAYHDLKDSPYQFTITTDKIDITTQFALVYQVPVGGVILKNTKSDFTAVVSPNPFNECFSLDVKSPLKEPIIISIFDVLGKQLSIETLNVETIKNVTFGKGLASGVYQVVITQGEFKETIKVIKN